ncbi:MAG: DNA mismatch repair protein MutS [Anaerolineaceae bacterium]|nr:DNA mismatch repair protein MutS [Anaerolineaceae bacterium]
MTKIVTPIRQQYLDIKNQYPNTIVFFRLGDFYETFDEDAEITARELDIVLTSRNVAKGERIPMAGIPYHAVENYLARLIEKGFHVAICEQIGEQPQKGIFPRKVVRVVTPGTIFEPGLLQGKANNYLACFNKHNSKGGIAFIDITTGEFFAVEFESDDPDSIIRDELLRLDPAEILHSEDTEMPRGCPGHISRWPSWRFETRHCKETLLRQFNVATLDGFGLRDQHIAVQAAGAIIQYIEETQPSSLKLIKGLTTYRLDDFMTLDAATRRNLELTETLRHKKREGSLLNVLDQTITPMGQRMILQWVSKPILDIKEINQRQEGISFLNENGLLRTELRTILKTINDLERLINRVISGHAIPRDLQSIRSTLSDLPAIIDLFPEPPASLAPIIENIHPCAEELSLLNDAICIDAPATLQKIGVINPSYSIELENVIESSRFAQEWISNLENIERNRSGIKNLKVGYNKVFGYYIEVTRLNSDKVPSDYIRKQTLVNAERFITPEMKEYEALVLNAEEQIHEIEARIFHKVCEKLANSGSKIQDVARNIAYLDTLASLAKTAVENGYCRPILSNDTVLNIRDGRHPVVEHTIPNKRFVPNDVILEDGEILRIVTGPNMSGKSTYLRQIALIVLMAQIGSYIPASSAEIGLVDRIFTRIGAQDEIHAGQSTFMVEMVETANILHHATSKSLLILDEIGRGTSTYDGVSIAWGVVEYIHNHPRLKSRTVFATHYHELTQISKILPGVRNYNVAVSEADGEIVFLHKIIPGGADRSYGIHVGQLAGLPGPIIQRAAEIMNKLETTSGKASEDNTFPSQQLALFPDTNPLIEDFKKLDINTLTPIEALNILYTWQKKYLEK